MAADSKTLPTDADVTAFLDKVEPVVRRQEAQIICALMAKVSGQPAVLWAGNLIGFGTYHFIYESGREGDYFRFGFAARKAQMTLYLISGFEAFGETLARLGPHKTSQSCLHIKKLAQIDLAVLEELLAASWAAMARAYPS
jgi:hypothetical protein